MIVTGYPCNVVGGVEAVGQSVEEERWTDGSSLAKP